MENLAHPYLFTLFLIQEIESGESVFKTVQKYSQEQSDEFSQQLVNWQQRHFMGQAPLPRAHLSMFRRSLFDLLDISVKGLSILTPLKELEKEMKFVTEQNIEQHLGILPFKLLIPLLLFQFPAFMLLLLGPLLSQLLLEVQ